MIGNASNGSSESESCLTRPTQLITMLGLTRSNTCISESTFSTLTPEIKFLEIFLLKNFKGADIVEVNPALDFNLMTSRLGAKLLSEMI